MSSNIKGLLFVVLGILSLLWFAYETVNYFSHRGVPTEDNAVISLTLTALKLVMAISFFFSAFMNFRKKD